MSFPLFDERDGGRSPDPRLQRYVDRAKVLRVRAITNATFSAGKVNT
jgi:hypothetical protein